MTDISPLPPASNGTISRLTVAFRRVVGQPQAATIDTVATQRPPSPLQPVNLTSAEAINAVLDLAARVGDALIACGMGNKDAIAHIKAVAEAYGIHDVQADITFNAITLYTDIGPTAGPLSTFRAVGHFSLDFSRLEEVDALIRAILAGRIAPDRAIREIKRIHHAPTHYNAPFILICWGVFTAGITYMNGGGLLAATCGFIAAVLIMAGSMWLGARGLPLFFQNVYGGFVATIPAAVAYQIAQINEITVNPSAIIAAGIIAMLAGLSLFQALQDGITGAPVTASARFFDTALATGAICGGVGLGLTTLTAVGMSLPPFDSTTATSITANTVMAIGGGLSGPFFALASNARLRSTLVTTITTLIGCALFFMILRPLGVKPMVASAIAAILIGLFGGLLSRRFEIPPLITAVAGITPLLPGLGLYRGMYAILSGDMSLGFSLLAAAFGTATALAAGVVLGEWMARRIRRPQILTVYYGRRRIRRPKTV